MNFVKKFNLASLLNCVFFILVITYTVFLSRFCGFESDDYYFGTYEQNEGYFDTLNVFKDRLHGGGYVCLFLTKFLNFGLPVLFGLHPADFMTYPYGFIKGCILALTLFSLAKFSNMFVKSKIFQTATLSITTVVFFLLLHPYFDLSNYYYTNCIVNNNNFFRYPLSILAFAFFGFYLYKLIVSKCNKKWNFKHIILSVFLCFFACILATNFEILTLSTLCLFLFLFAYNVLISVFYKSKEKLYKHLKFNFNFEFYVYFMTFLLFIVLYWLNGQVKVILVERGLSNISIDIKTIIEFASVYFKIYFLNIYWFWIILIGLIISAFKIAHKKAEIKKVMFPVFIILAIIISIFSLIFCGKTYYEAGVFWLEHGNIIFAYRILLLIPFFMILSFLLSKIKTNKYKFINYVSIFIIIISIVFSFFIRENKHFVDVYYNCKKEHYMFEKIFRFYYLNDRTPILPNYSISRVISTENVDDCTKSERFTTSYYPRIYRDYKSIEMGYCIKENALESFYKEGGVFTEEELKLLNFSRLFDENFVLNKKID